MLLNLVYSLALLTLWPYFLYHAVLHGKYREHWREKFLGAAPQMPTSACGRPRVWFHAVSVGEVNLLKTLIARLNANELHWDFVVSTTSKTGYDLARRLFAHSCEVFYCPLDFTWAVKRALRRVKPDALVLIELELWPNLIKYAHKRNVPVVVVNGRISERSFRSYHRVRALLAPTFARLALVIAQDDLARDYFQKLSPRPERVLVSGSIKFDGASTDRNAEPTARLRELLRVLPEDVVYLCGSTQAPEEEGALEVYRRLYRDYPNLRLFIVPRHPERFEQVAQLLNASGLPWTRRSQLQAPLSAQTPNVDRNDDPTRIVLVDVMGELSALWGVAQLAFVGGSWGSRGGQNMLEPAGYGVAVSFGENTRNFRTIVESLLRADAAVVVRDVEESFRFVKTCLDQPEYARQLGQRAQELVLANQGAADFTLKALQDLLAHGNQS
ncbi:MAG: 3-deoxy-D-manno-octulosonic acid transferase [Planctomycetia bacterium]|nr:3-deoxy-D-manno-octulosonic acid transferase [Planctomycetia bacterium]